MTKPNTKQKSVWPELAAVFVSIAFVGLLANGVLDLIYSGQTISTRLVAIVLNITVYVAFVTALFKFFFESKHLEKIALTIALIEFSTYYIAVSDKLFAELIFTAVYYFFNYKFNGGRD